MLEQVVRGFLFGVRGVLLDVIALLTQGLVKVREKWVWSVAVKALLLLESPIHVHEQLTLLRVLDLIPLAYLLIQFSFLELMTTNKYLLVNLILLVQILRFLHFLEIPRRNQKLLVIARKCLSTLFQRIFKPIRPIFEKLTKLAAELSLHPLQIQQRKRKQSTVLNSLDGEVPLHIESYLWKILYHVIHRYHLLLTLKNNVNLSKEITLINLNIDHILRQRYHEASGATRQKIYVADLISLLVQILVLQKEFLL